MELVITDTFDKEGIAHLTDERQQEIEAKRRAIRLDLETDGRERHFYLALHADRIIGTVEAGPSSRLIHDLTQGAMDQVTEVGTVFVHPGYQGQGVGTLLLNAILLHLQGKGVSEFCLDSGYPRAQQLWTKKLGEPAYLLPDYWGAGMDHMIWRCNMEKIVTGYSPKGGLI
ncbi:GNAT family N-acetyltransferase [Paenibacillus aurantius]|uniref:GNAT family N-acetyltransferase n=1 Tax=Paenibacillus aurantius TaxID=2918900 RepID=A0AA96LLE1_9BACL|nr:GNAT family N-acetyltransferase [Paenibacillus aurantius]WNQ14251.1 GNAT family N-acetyltransferase [Paenibacillus aurantius]